MRPRIDVGYDRRATGKHHRHLRVREREIWGYPSDVMSRTVDMHIMELRRELEVGPANPRHFHTVRKTG